MKDKNSDNNQGSNCPPERTDFFRVIIDLDFRILNFNDCFCYLSGYSREDLFSKNLLELMAEKNIKQVTGPPITLDHLIKTDKPVKYLDVFSTDGGEQTYQINLIPISGKISEIEKVCIIFKEFSDKDHHFEEKVLFNLFFKNSLVPQVILDNTLKITDMNDAFCQMVRYSYD